MHIKIIAHRGASADAPENTMPAFKLALEQGAQMLEFDVRPTRDGAVVVFHDDTTERWNGRPDVVSRLTWDELRAVTIDGEPVALFEGVCEWAATTGMLLNVELKVRGIEASVGLVPTIEEVDRIGDCLGIKAFSHQVDLSLLER